MLELLYTVCRAENYMKCLRSNPPILEQDNEDLTQVCDALLGEQSLILLNRIPDTYPNDEDADILVAFEMKKLERRCRRFSFHTLLHACDEVRKQGYPLTEQQLPTFRRSLDVRKTLNDIAFAAAPQDLRTAAFIGVRNHDLLAKIQEITDMKHVYFRSPTA